MQREEGLFTVEWSLGSIVREMFALQYLEVVIACGNVMHALWLCSRTCCFGRMALLETEAEYSPRSYWRQGCLACRWPFRAGAVSGASFRLGKEGYGATVFFSRWRRA